jgi:hypothetical protein
MSSFGERDPLIPDDPELYAPPRLRERTTSSLSQEARLEPIRSSPISLPASLENQDNDAFWNPLDPEVINERARIARDRRTVQLSIAAAAAGVVTVVVLLFFIMMPPSRQSDARSTSSEITGSTSTALRQSSPGGVGSKPALEEFRALLASPPSQPATQEQSQPLLQHFLQWRKKANTTETSQ